MRNPGTKISNPRIHQKYLASEEERMRNVENDDEMPLKQYDKVLFHPKDAIPVEFEHDNQLFVVPVDDIVAVFRSND